MSGRFPFPLERVQSKKAIVIYSIFICRHVDSRFVSVLIVDSHFYWPVIYVLKAFFLLVFRVFFVPNLSAGRDSRLFGADNLTTNQFNSH